MKKWISTLLVGLVAVSVLSACKEGGDKASAQTPFDGQKNITVVSREEGSGTRGAFIELFNIEAKNADGSKKDMTTKEAVIANKTDVMLKSVTSDPGSIGYVSMGSLNPTINALKIEGVAPTVDNVKNGTYKIARPFNIATKGEPTGVTKDFIDFILSVDGQKVVGKSYIPAVSQAIGYFGAKPAGKVVVAGSSSVTPIMEKLKEAYLAINPNAKIEIQMSDSTAGMTGAINGTCDIGMASRALKINEMERLQKTEIAIDGIAVVVNTKNPTESLSKEQVKNIFTGATTKWNELGKP